MYRPYYRHKTLRLFLARDAFVRTNRHAIAVMLFRLTVRPSICLGRACIVIIRRTLARI